MMKTLIVIVVSAALGLAVGFGVAWARLDESPSISNPIRKGGLRSPIMSTDASPTKKYPKMVVDSETFDFGVMDENAVGSHDFTFTNTGEAVLELGGGKATCGCTKGILVDKKIPPGKSGVVRVEWRPEHRFGAFREAVHVQTNDPNWPQVDVAVTGRITTAMRADPTSLVLSHVTAGESAKASTHIWGYLPEPLEVTGFQMGESKIQDKFDVTWAPLPADEVKEEQDATNGFLVEVTVKPGLPPGPFRQTIVLSTNLKDHPAVSLEVRGRVGGEISVVGPGWNEDSNLLNIGTINGREGAERTLLIVVRGPERKDVQFKVVEIVPDSIEVDEEALAQITELPGSAVTQTPLKVRIPPGTGPANHLGSEQGKLGRITIETNHPKVPRLNVYVRFAVEG